MLMSFGELPYLPACAGWHEDSQAVITAVEPCRPCSDPALVIANEDDAGELALRMLLVGSYQRQRTICSTTPVLCQPFSQAEDRIVWIDLGIVCRRIDGMTTLSGLRRRMAAANSAATSMQPSSKLHTANHFLGRDVP